MKVICGGVHLTRHNINTSFNQFLNIFLRHSYESFPITSKQKYKQKSWITNGIRISCRNKRILYVEAKISNNPIIATHYKNYCKILIRVINLAKKMTYDNQIKY